MGIKPSEISALIKEQIKNYAHEMEQNDVGTIVSVGDGVCLIYGLDKAMYGELLEFPNNVYGLVMNLEEEHVGAVLLGDSKEVKEGDVVKAGDAVGLIGSTGYSYGPHLHFEVRIDDVPVNPLMFVDYE